MLNRRFHLNLASLWPYIPFPNTVYKGRDRDRETEKGGRGGEREKGGRRKGGKERELEREK